MCGNGFTKTLLLPTRAASASTGAAFAKTLESLELPEREGKIYSEISDGNVPNFLRNLCPINITNVADTKTNIATFFVTPDYLCVGSDKNYFLSPLTPFTAQKLADATDCILPTPKMVNAIYAQAAVKLAPSPLPPTPAMVTVPVFERHNATVCQQRAAFLERFPLGALTAGHKKDVVITSRLKSLPGKVAIYGWHQTNGVAIQPVYHGHAASWADYSHGVRLVSKKLIVNGDERLITDVLADPELTKLLSDEGVISQPRYVFSEFPKPAKTTSLSSGASNKVVLGQFRTNAFFDEQVMWLQLDHGVRVLINSPSAKDLAAQKKMTLVFYALPNGSTIEQTIGKQLKPGDDWHFDIQHIGAQTRFVRRRLTNENIVIAYLENSLKSWPAWRKQFGDTNILKVFETVCGRFEAYEPKIVLTGHSGGGSFTFGYLNSVEKISNDVERISFLDSNYGYDTSLHFNKFTQWLESSGSHFLTVLAYHDDIALLNGKTFVSASGGTWGRSHLMKKDFASQFEFSEEIFPKFNKYSALKGRLQFLLTENPEKKILHTVLVEKNGFIHSLLNGTPFEESHYEYFGNRAYAEWIQPE